MLPSAELAVVERKKLTEYLLCRTHPNGSSKAAFFLHFGFRLEQWEVLASALRGVAASNPITSRESTAHGVKYTVDGVIECPNGRGARIRTVWLIAAETSPPRLVSAYPQEAREIKESIMNAIKEFECAVLLAEVPAERLIDGNVDLVAGDVGVVVEILSAGAAYILEFFALDGYTIAIAEVDAAQIRPIDPHDLHHARHAA